MKLAIGPLLRGVASKLRRWIGVAQPTAAAAAVRWPSQSTEHGRRRLILLERGWRQNPDGKRWYHPDHPQRHEQWNFDKGYTFRGALRRERLIPRTATP